MTHLKIIFGQDQKPYIEKIIEEMGNLVAGYSINNIQENLCTFDLDFVSAYSCYLFGHKTAQLHKYVLDGK